MDAGFRAMLWGQFGAAIEMLENAIAACPEEPWGDRSRQPEYWYVVYHTLFFLDFYLSETPDGFAPPAPFNLEELDPAGILPPRVYTKSEMQTYLDHGRRKCRSTIASLSDDVARRPCAFGRPLTVLELLLYNMRHVQHHAAQLNLILRQTIDSAPRWVGKASVDLE
jgi:hypothetical protein